MGGASDDCWASLPLRERLPEYVTMFGVGLVSTAVVGFAVGVVFGIAMPVAIGFTFFALGLFCLLGGGAQGGRYGALGLGAAAGRVKFTYDEDPNVLADLRSVRRPGRNPAAFWMVVAGVLYTAIGLLVTNLG